MTYQGNPEAGSQVVHVIRSQSSSAARGALRIRGRCNAMVGLSELFGGDGVEQVVSAVPIPGGGKRRERVSQRRRVPVRLGSSWPTCHKDFKSDCPQCRFQVYGRKWMETCGTVTQRLVSGTRKIVWLQERAFRPGLEWGVGCAVCAAFLWRLGQDIDVGRRPRLIGKLRCETKWAKLEVRSRVLQCSAIVQHSRSDIHKVAMHAYLRPQRPLDVVLGDEEVAALPLLRGAVPPPEHWLRVWRFVQSPTSYRSSEAILGTEAFLSHLRTGVEESAASRKSVGKSVACMAEVVRSNTRKVLLAAHSITIALDDRGPYRVFRFRCDAERTDPRLAACPHGWRRVPCDLCGLPRRHYRSPRHSGEAG